MLATKLFAPTSRQQLVQRPRLVRLLDTGLDPGHRLTVVSAPAGFGKTTVLADWLAHLAGSATSTRVGWVSLDQGDNEPTRFLAYVVAALQGAGLDVAATLDSPGQASPTEALTSLVNEVTRLAGTAADTQWVVVLDDYHAIDAPEVHEAVTFLLEHLPAQLHLVVATRSDPPLALARLRSRGQLTEVRAADLRFTPEEARRFLNQVMGLDLTAADVGALEDRTEGWIAGLQLAGLSLRGITERDEVLGFIDAFAGSNRFVIDYLADEVLSRQPDPVRDFLLRTAVLDRLTGPLCDAVTGRADGATTLEELERGNLFVVPLDQQRSWYRYHHLFRDVLRARLVAERPDQAAELHRRASAWFSDQDLVGEAVQHALAAPDFERAALLVEQALPRMRRLRQDATLLSWIRALPDPVVRRSPVLCVTACWSSMRTGDLDAAEAWLDDADAALAAGDADPAHAAAWADTEDLRTAPGTIAVYRASLAQAHGDVAGTVRHARRALDLAGPQDHFVRGAGSGFVGLAAWAAGDVHAALTTFTEAVRSLHAAGNLVDELDSTVVLADMWVTAGRPGRARRLYERALQTVTAGGPPYPRAAADLHIGLAELDLEADDLASAEAHLAQAHDLGERPSITENRHRRFVVLAKVRAAVGDLDAAVDLLDQAEALYRHGFYPDIRPIPAMRARLSIARGDLADAEAWAQEQGVTTNDAATYLREYDHLTLVRLLLARHRAGQPAALDGALALLDRLRAEADPDRPGSLAEIGVLRALVLDELGDRTQALADLEAALAVAPEPDGHARLLLDEGAPLAALLADVEHPLVRVPAAAPVSGPVDQPGPLSRRELDVLRLLGSELTGPEIARELYVTVNTLRTHTKRIFTKLDVTSRAAAVRRAQELGLL